MAFILGVFPLVISTGAGAASRHEIGTGVIGGMLFATFLGLLLIPVFYVVVRRLLGDKLDEVSHKMPHHDDGDDQGGHGEHDGGRPPRGGGHDGGGTGGVKPAGEGTPARRDPARQMRRASVSLASAQRELKRTRQHRRWRRATRLSTRPSGSSPSMAPPVRR
jgi:hypothetical protein